MRRRIIAEDLNWSLALVPPLSNLCLKCVVNHYGDFLGKPLFDILEPVHQTFIEEELSPSTSLHVTANSVPDGIYWKRCCQQKWALCDVSLYGHSWRRMFFERHLESIIELFVPGSTSPSVILEMIPLCRDYVKRLNISQLLPPTKEPEDEEDEDESDLELENKNDTPIFHHFEFGILLDKLNNLEELHLAYRVKQCGMNFKWEMFEMTEQDCQSLAKALKSCKTLKILKLRDSHVDDRQCRLLVKHLLDHPSLRELDFAYNRIGDGGARAIGKLLNSGKLESLNLCNNRISSEGAKAIAHALSNNSTLLSINMRLNHLGDEGGQAFGKALLNNGTLLHLHLGATGVTAPTAVVLSNALVRNETLKKINLSCNKLGEVGGKALVEAMSKNSRMTECDIRLTEVDEQSLTYITNKVCMNLNSEDKERRDEIPHFP